MISKSQIFDEIFKLLLKEQKIQKLCNVRHELNRDLKNRIINFPPKCNLCHLSFTNVNDFIKKTRRLASPEEAFIQPNSQKKSYVDFRLCSCKTLLPFQVNNRRDNSQFGRQAREIFDECLVLIKNSDLALLPGQEQPFLRDIFRQLIKNGYFTITKIDWIAIETTDTHTDKAQ